MKKLYLQKILATLTLVGMVVMMPFSVQAVTIIPEGRATSGDITISGSRTEDSVKSNVTVLANSGVSTITVNSSSGFATGTYVYIGQMIGTGAGNYEINKIQAINGNVLSFYSPTVSAYQSTGAQIIQIGEYHNVTVASGGTWTASAWDGTKGGVLIALLNGGLTLQTGGSITASALGFAGGSGSCSSGGSNNCGTPKQGDSTLGTGVQSTGANGIAGGAGTINGVPQTSSGGGGGYGTSGSNGGTQGATVGTGGGTIGGVSLSTLFFGGGAGGGQQCCDPSSGGGGGKGGGIIFLAMASSTFSGGTFTNGGSNGSAGNTSGGGGGAGGSIRLTPRLNLTLGTGIITASAGTGGSSGSTGGTGGVGRIATLSGTVVAGTATPTIDTSSTDRVQNKDNEAMTINLSSSI